MHTSLVCRFLSKVETSAPWSVVGVIYADFWKEHVVRGRGEFGLSRGSERRLGNAVTSASI